MVLGALRRSQLLGSALLIVTFGVGALVGAAGERFRENRREDQERQERQARDRDRRTGRQQQSIFLEPGVFDQIGATSEQRKQIQDILARRDSGSAQIFREMRPRLDAVMDSTRGELRAVLTDEQRAKLDKIIQERHERWQQNRRNSQDGRPSDSAKKQDSAKQ